MTTATAAPADADIWCEDLVRIFATDGIEVQALQGLNLRVDAGELVAVVGASGSGKSTLLTILAGLDRPSAGNAVVAGTNLVTMTDRRRTAFNSRCVRRLLERKRGPPPSWLGSPPTAKRDLLPPNCCVPNNCWTMPRETPPLSRKR